MAARTKMEPDPGKPKYRYRVTNWAEYDRALVSRGDLTIWFDAASIKDGWTPAPPVGRGKPGLYSALAIQTCLTLKTLFRLPYRATEGLMKSLMQLNGLDLPVPDHTHMSRRAAQLAVKIPRRPRQGPVHVVVDSTGLKIFGEGEWKVRQHGVGKRRTWRKIHLAVDETAKDINHLSYIGDAEVGAACNIGAGTITCNYDGANKHKTIIGDDVFVGSDTQLVAPVTVGSGATIGAGSTITNDVPEGVLALSRSPQVAREGWRRPRKQR